MLVIWVYYENGPFGKSAKYHVGVDNSNMVALPSQQGESNSPKAKLNPRTPGPAFSNASSTSVCVYFALGLNTASKTILVVSASFLKNNFNNTLIKVPLRSK